MTWDDFYERYDEWSDSTLSSRISSLKEMGPSSEIAEVAGCLKPEFAEKLIKKAVSMGKIFTPDDLMELNYIVQKSTLDSLAELFMTTKKTMKPDDIIELSYMLSSTMIDKVVRYNADMGLEFTVDLIIELDGNVSTDALMYALKKKKRPLTSEDLDELEGVIDIRQLKGKTVKPSVSTKKTPANPSAAPKKTSVPKKISLSAKKKDEDFDDDPDDFDDDEYDDSYDYADTSGKKPGLLDKLGVFFLVSSADKHARKRRERRQSEPNSPFHPFRNTPAKYHIGDYVKVRSRRKGGTIVDVHNKRYDIRLDDGTYLSYVSEMDIERSLF